MINNWSSREEESSAAAAFSEAEGGSSRRDWARTCDSCRSTPCLVYCPADAAYLCADCDDRVHDANRVAARHERVWVCEACERAPAMLTCRADTAALCAVCDADVHSANPLASRHYRVSILPVPPGHCRQAVRKEAAVWEFPGGSNEGDEYLDLVEYNGTENEDLGHQYGQQNNVKNNSTDRVEPFECLVPNEQQQQDYPIEMEYEVSNAGFSYSATSLTHSVSISSMETGVVPDSSTMTDISNSGHIRASKETIIRFSSSPQVLQMPAQFTTMDREARVLRYREKRKARKFEKTIRYASRKAYAETRPRIKGRFAKRSEVDLEVDQMFATSEGSYGIVPSF